MEDDQVLGELRNRSKKLNDNDIDGYGKFLFDQGPQLQVKEDKLRDDKKQLRDRLAQLGVKEDRLRDDKRRMEENLKKQKV